MPENGSSDLRLRNTAHPILYEINTRVLLHELSVKAGKKITLATLPDAVIDEWAASGFDAIWLMGVWSVGKLGIQIALEDPGLRESYRKALPDFSDNDVIGSPYAVSSYTIARSLGGLPALQSLRKRLAGKGLGLVLDYVCNHTARDHSWISSHPEYYIHGREEDDVRRPEYYFKAKTRKGERIIAYGRDPYYPGWTDTAQLNPWHAKAREAMIDVLHKTAELCDGVRCDMAMLILNEVFQKTWADQTKPDDGQQAPGEFWAEAIQSVRKEHPDFIFLAEAYWGMEWPLQELGFNYTYDKTMYDRLLREGAGAVYDHLKAEMIYQKRSARFIENHDEPRIAHVLPNEAWQYAAATVAATVPGMLLLHEGQLEGRKVKLPVQLRRRPVEEVSVLTKTFYAKLLSCLNAETIRKGEWKLLTTRAAWHENYSHHNIIAGCWRKDDCRRLVIVNYAPRNSQCYVDVNVNEFAGTSFEFRDLMSPSVFVRDRTGLQHKGMYFDLPGYGLHVFEVTAVKGRG